MQKKDKIVPKKRRDCVEIRDSCSRRMWGRVQKKGCEGVEKMNRGFRRKDERLSRKDREGAEE